MFATSIFTLSITSLPKIVEPNDVECPLTSGNIPFHFGAFHGTEEAGQEEEEIQ